MKIGIFLIFLNIFFIKYYNDTAIKNLYAITKPIENIPILDHIYLILELKNGHHYKLEFYKHEDIQKQINLEYIPSYDINSLKNITKNNNINEANHTFDYLDQYKNTIYQSF